MRKLVWFTVGYGTGCFVCAYLALSGWLWLSLAAAILFAGCMVLRAWKKLFSPVAAVMLGLCLSFAGIWVYDKAYLHTARDFNGQTIDLLVVSDDYSSNTDYGCVVEGTVYLGDTPFRVWTYLNEVSGVEPGDLIDGTFLLKFTADGGSDVAPQFRGKGIFLIAYQRGNAQVTKGAYFAWYHNIAQWRRTLQKTLDSVLDEKHASIANALLLGDKSDLDYTVETAFKISGISHIVAVSGLHVSILFGLIYLLSARKRVLTALIGIPAVLLFAALAGYSASVTRACLMQILVMLALLCKREYDPPTALAFSVLVMLIVNPLSVTSVSLQLSAACMAGIFLFSKRNSGWIMDPKRLGRWRGKSIRGRVINALVVSISMSVSAVVLTIPLSAYYFGTVSLVGPVTNLLTLWIVSFVFYCILGLCAIGTLIPTIAAGLAVVVSWGIDYVVCVAEFMSSLPFSAVFTQSGWIVAWLVLCYLLVVLYFCVRRKYAGFLAAVAVVTFLLANAVSWAIPAADAYRVTVLDVGQGQCIILQAEGRTFVLDCGGDHNETAANIAAETLLSQGITQIDGMIVTHYDTDHSGGVPYLLSRVDADLLYIPDTADPAQMGQKMLAQTAAAVTMVGEDYVIAFGDSKITIFAADSYNSGNESSLCVLFQTNNCDILITGDRGERGEEMLIKRHDIPDLEILIVGHHGSGASTSEAFLEKTKPDYGVISVGADNPYGHPMQAVLDRLNAVGCIVYRTDLEGNIIIKG